MDEPEELPMGMVDTGKYKAEDLWLAGSAGLGDTNAWMTMFGLYFRYGIEEKYKNQFKDFRVRGTRTAVELLERIKEIRYQIEHGTVSTAHAELLTIAANHAPHFSATIENQCVFNFFYKAGSHYA